MNKRQFKGISRRLYLLACDLARIQGLTKRTMSRIQDEAEQIRKLGEPKKAEENKTEMGK